MITTMQAVDWTLIVCLLVGSGTIAIFLMDPFGGD